MATTSRPRATKDVDYPTSDGKPMAESDLHRDVMVDTIQMLKDYFADQPDVYVSGNLFMYYVEGDRRTRSAPKPYASVPKPRMPFGDSLSRKTSDCARNLRRYAGERRHDIERRCSRSWGRVDCCRSRAPGEPLALDPGVGAVHQHCRLHD